MHTKLIKRAYVLSIITILYNFIEGGISMFYGADDETLALFGFGVDSFAEVLSGVGIAHMIWRMEHNNIESRDKFEVTALRITGFALYMLAGGLVIGSILSVAYQSQPYTTMAGVIISSISIATMYFLYKSKLKVGQELRNQPIISDANCTKTCFYLSFILLASSLLYEVWKIPYVDALGSLGIAWYALKEGREAFGKAKSKMLSCNDHCC